MSRNTTKSLVALVAVLLVVALSGASLFYAKYVMNSEGEFSFFARPYTIAFATLDAEGTLRIYNRKMAEAPEANTVFDGVTITNVYKLPCGLPDRAVDPAGEIPAWTDASASVENVIVVDDIAPQGTTADWFSGFTNCWEMNLTKLDTSNVTNMSGMFEDCADLTELDLSSFVTAEATVNCARMFSGCYQLETVYVSLSWDPDNIASNADMFADCTAMVGAAATRYSADCSGNTYAHIDGVGGDGYFTYGGVCADQALLLCRLNGVTVTLAAEDGENNLPGGSVSTSSGDTPVVLVAGQENEITLTALDGYTIASELTIYTEQTIGHLVNITLSNNNTISIPSSLCKIGKMVYLDLKAPEGYVIITPEIDASGKLDYAENGGGYYYDFDSIFSEPSAAWTDFY